MAGRIAEWLGRTLRALLVFGAPVGRALPGAAAPCLLIYGVALIYPPAGWIVAGLLLFLVDRRT